MDGDATATNSAWPAARVCNVWRSRRLEFRAVDEGDEAFRAFILRHVLNDPGVAVLSSGELLRPQTARDGEAFVKMLGTCTLGVAVCLAATARPEAPATHPGAAAPPPPPDDIIGFLALAPTRPLAQPHHRSCDLSISLAAHAQGRGYGREAVAWALDWAFRHAGLHRVGLSAAAYNARALRLYRALGFVDEGCQRQRIRLDGEWHDLLLLSVLEHEWRARRVDAGV